MGGKWERGGRGGDSERDVEREGMRGKGGNKGKKGRYEEDGEIGEKRGR